ncbi:zinc finger protein 813-like isoform X2 [Vespula pensylvanica]|uniref:zinc finger protein 813-like isoform X2 n=1 Tax=Vespula pensylvanica TaxID=30213 RepID=UPI001CBA40FB|nr:zinc finger protein 813-like isoform X2 [Vespula pensylvanica]
MRTTPRSSPASVERVFASTGAAFASRAGVLHGKMSSLDYLDLCRLCLVKDRVSVPIFEGEGDVRQIFLKITACLPVKVDREDKLPKKICDDCVYKVELFYQFWNTSVNAEKQLLQWLGEVGLEEKTDYVTNVLNQNVMKSDPSGGNRLDGSMLQQVSGHQNNMGMGMMDNISLSMPMMISTTNQQQITSVPMDTSGSSVQEMPGTSTQSTHEQITQSQTNTSNQHEEEEESSEEEENSEDECDGEEGLPVKEESEEDPNNSRVIEPTTFVNVSLACDEAGPSGLQQQKVTEMPEMAMQQSTDGDPKSGDRNFAMESSEMDKLDHSAEEKDSIVLLQHDCSNIKLEDTFLSGTVENQTNTMSSLLSVKKEIEEHSARGQGKTIIKYHNCDRCGMKFPLRTMLNRHRLSHNVKHSIPKIKCSKEKYGYSKTSDLRQYSKSVFGQIEKRDYTCNLCNFACEKSITLTVHLKRKHRINEVKSVSNNRKCSSNENNSSKRRSTKKSKKVYHFCDICDFECTKGDVLAAHVAQCHRKSEKRIENSSSRSNKWNYEVAEAKEEKYDGEVQKNVSMFSCSCCTFRCKKRSTMTSHVNKKHSNKATLEERCDLCDFKCAKKSTLYSHKRQHKIEALNQVYACNECDFKTIKRTSLYSHIKRKHKTMRSCTGNDQPELFYCNQCDYKNKNKYELKVHVARKHTDDFKFSCETCGKKFKVKGDLTNHIRFSHREQPVICDVCGKTCLNSNSLYVHQKFAHYKAQYECQVCKRRMVSQENLNEHMIRQHERKENVVCEECGKTFSRNSRLKVHMRIHTGDKPYTCTICSKAFARRTALKQHLLIHTGMRPYDSKRRWTFFVRQRIDPNAAMANRRFGRLSLLRICSS